MTDYIETSDIEYVKVLLATFDEDCAVPFEDGTMRKICRVERKDFSQTVISNCQFWTEPGVYNIPGPVLYIFILEPRSP